MTDLFNDLIKEIFSKCILMKINVNHSVKLLEFWEGLFLVGDSHLHQDSYVVRFFFSQL